jgi:hypothetical protein
MKLLVFAVVLAVMQTAPLVPRKAADSTAGTRQSIKDQASSNKRPAPIPAPPVNTDATSGDKAKSYGIRADNAQQAIRVTELPSVSVHPQRDWADWGYWVFSGLLVIVGGLQVWLLLRTLNQVRRQADIYDQQRLQMIKAGEQTDKLIETMRDTAIREQRAYVCLSHAKIEFRQERAPEIQVYMKNFGKTPAYDVRWWIHVWIAEYPLREKLPEPPSTFQTAVSIFAPGGDPHIMVTRHDPPIPEDMMSHVGTEKGTIFVYGKVIYKDAFGNNRFTNYRLTYGGSEPVHPRQNPLGFKVDLLKTDREGNEAN